jgi:hypothetical protein
MRPRTLLIVALIVAVAAVVYASHSKGGVLARLLPAIHGR